MNLNDGFNERNTFIRRSNDMNKLRKNGPSKFDNSFAKMRTEERRGIVKTTNSNMCIKPLEDVRGVKDNFVVQNSHINNFNRSVNKNNRVTNALNRNRFNRPN